MIHVYLNRNSLLFLIRQPAMQFLKCSYYTNKAINKTSKSFTSKTTSFNTFAYIPFKCFLFLKSFILLFFKSRLLLEFDLYKTIKDFWKWQINVKISFYLYWYKLGRNSTLTHLIFLQLPNVSNPWITSEIFFFNMMLKCYFCN